MMINDYFENKIKTFQQLNIADHNPLMEQNLKFIFHSDRSAIPQFITNRYKQNKYLFFERLFSFVVFAFSHCVNDYERIYFFQKAALSFIDSERTGVNNYKKFVCLMAGLNLYNYFESGQPDLRKMLINENLPDQFYQCLLEMVDQDFNEEEYEVFKNNLNNYLGYYRKINRHHQLQQQLNDIERKRINKIIDSQLNPNSKKISKI